MDICKRREEEFRSQEPGGGQLSQDPGGKEEAVGKELCLPEGYTYLSLPVKLGGHVLPAGIPAPDVEWRELYSLLLSHRERDVTSKFNRKTQVGLALR